MSEILIPKSKSERKRLEALGAIPKPPTEEELREWRASHQPDVDSEGTPYRCSDCLEPWPCRTDRLIGTYLHPEAFGLIPIAPDAQLSEALGLTKRVDDALENHCEDPEECAELTAAVVALLEAMPGYPATVDAGREGE